MSSRLHTSLQIECFSLCLEARPGLVFVLICPKPKYKLSHNFRLCASRLASGNYRHHTLAVLSLQTRQHIIDGKKVEAKAAVPRNSGSGNLLTKKMFVGGTVRAMTTA